MVKRPTEVKLVADILGSEANDGLALEDIAEQIIEALDQSRAKRDQWIVLAQEDGRGLVYRWGTFPTRQSADRWIKAELAPPSKVVPMRAAAMKLQKVNHA